MEIRSLGFRSELIFLGFDGEVIDRGDYTVVRTPTNPNFFWGNLLIFDRPPRAGDFEEWGRLFRKELTDPRIYHRTLAWDSPGGGIGDPAEFSNAGYQLEATAVLGVKANQIVRPERYNSTVEIRPLASADEWMENIELQTRSGGEQLPPIVWRDFYEKQTPRFQAMVAAGMGHWFGAFLDGKLVASQGLFHSRDASMGRYQSVVTDENHRRQGIAATMVYELARHAFESRGVKDLVMCADPGGPAIHIYKSVGFKEVVTQHGLCWWDKTRSP